MEYNKWILQLLGFHKHLQRIDMLYNHMYLNECLKQWDMFLDKYKLKVILIHVFSDFSFYGVKISFTGEFDAT